MWRFRQSLVDNVSSTESNGVAAAKEGSVTGKILLKSLCSTATGHVCSYVAAIMMRTPLFRFNLNVTYWSNSKKETSDPLSCRSWKEAVRARPSHLVRGVKLISFVLTVVFVEILDKISLVIEIRRVLTDGERTFRLVKLFKAKRLENFNCQLVFHKIGAKP